MAVKNINVESDNPTSIPGPRSLNLARRLAMVESPDTTCLKPSPIFWERASGSHIWDVDGNRFVDLSGAFGVANVGHSHPLVVKAIHEQIDRLLHGMGDVHPTDIKVELLEALCKRYPGKVKTRATLGSSGSDAVETAIKTALIATGKPGIIAFEGAYHGLSLGALDTTSRLRFRDPFDARLPHSTLFAKFGDVSDVQRVGQESKVPIGAVLVEPIQARGGERIPPYGFLKELREVCDRENWLLIADEIYTGFGRTGRLFACQHEEVVPDLMCVGKGLSSGMPISACIGRSEVMEAWPISSGEALHTQTFLGHPPSCAAALASISILESENLCGRSKEIGAAALDRLRTYCEPLESVRDTRGIGLMLGIECADSSTSLKACNAALQEGIILLPSGTRGEVLSITPPLSIDRTLLFNTLDRLIGCIG